MLVKNRIAIVFISGSAGELDWILPILNFLLEKNFCIKIIFLSRHALKSVKENSMCNDFINQKNNNVEVIINGGYLFEKIEHIGYLSYRIFLKLKLDKIFLTKTIYSFYEYFFKIIFMKCLPSEISKFKDKKYLFISEFPSLRRPRNNWIKNKFKKSIFFYCPHSPHIYTQELDRIYEEKSEINYNKQSFLLLGHPGDYHAINDEKEMASEDIEKLFIGHPKYSKDWVQNLKKEVRDFRNSFKSRKKINILLLSRGYGSYLDEKSHTHLVNSSVSTIEELIPNYNLYVKKHPRETHSHWDVITKNHSSIEISNKHIMELATKANFIISFWGSGAMDCFLLGVPIIEYWNPEKNYKQQVLENGSYTTIYKKLGIIFPAKNEKELKKAIIKVMESNFEIKSVKPHLFFSDLINRSNTWKIIFEKIIVTHGLLD